MGILRFWRRRQRDEELTRELEAYVAQETEEHIAQGLTPEEAPAAALRKLGNVTRVRETVHDMYSLGWIERLAKDFRYAGRVLWRSRGFTIAAIVSLTLGIGANTAIFGLLNAIRLRSLPVQRPHELAEVTIVGGNRGMGLSDRAQSGMTYPLWEALRTHQKAFAGVFAWSTSQARDVVRMILGQACRLLLLGLAIGTLVALGLGRSARSLLFGLQPNDASTLQLGGVRLTHAGAMECRSPRERGRFQRGDRRGRANLLRALVCLL